mgnify:FL=1|jgi:hypothetical protein
MADETKTAKAVTPKGFKLVKGAAMDLRGVNFKVTNELLKNPNVIAVIQRNCPEAFSEGLIVPA